MALILIIDDSSYMRGIIRSSVEKDGHEILEAENGLQGIQIASSHSPDCILLDIIMLVVDRMKILKSYHEKNSRIPLNLLVPARPVYYPGSSGQFTLPDLAYDCHSCTFPESEKILCPFGST